MGDAWWARLRADPVSRYSLGRNRLICPRRGGQATASTWISTCRRTTATSCERRWRATPSCSTRARSSHNGRQLAALCLICLEQRKRPGTETKKTCGPSWADATLPRDWHWLIRTLVLTRLHLRIFIYLLRDDCALREEGTHVPQFHLRMPQPCSKAKTTLNADRSGLRSCVGALTTPMGTPGSRGSGKAGSRVCHLYVHRS